MIMRIWLKWNNDKNNSWENIDGQAGQIEYEMGLEVLVGTTISILTSLIENVDYEPKK